MRKLIAGMVLSSSLALGLVAAPATADSWTWRDRGGGRGPLAIQSVHAGHGNGQPMLTITFDRALDPARMGRKDFVVVDVELDGRGKSDLLLYFVSAGDRLRSFTYEPRWKEWGRWAPFARPTPRTLRVALHPYSDVGGVAFAVASYSEAAGCGEACWDVVPNRGYLIHDYTPPAFSRFGAPREFWLEPQVPVRWRATDRGLSGMRGTTLMVSEAGTGKWRRVATRGAGRQQAMVPAVAGSHMMFEVVAQDRSRNVTRSSRSLGYVLTRIPHDQGNESGPGTFTGAWLEEDDTASMGGTVHTSGAPLDKLSFAGTGNLYCVSLHWATNVPGAARLQAGDEFVDLLHGVAEGAVRQPYCVQTRAVDERTATLTVEAGRVSVDWYWAGIDGQWTGRGTLQEPGVLQRHADDPHVRAVRGPRLSLERFRRAAHGAR